MFDQDNYLNDLIYNCRAAFKERLLYVGLQGSWLRGEARENSDIDIMVSASSCWRILLPLRKGWDVAL